MSTHTKKPNAEVFGPVIGRAISGLLMGWLFGAAATTTTGRLSVLSRWVSRINYVGSALLGLDLVVLALPRVADRLAAARSLRRKTP